MDIRVKLIVMLVFLFGTVVIDDMKILLIAFGFVFLGLAILRIPLTMVKKRFLFSLPFIGIMIILIPFQVPGEYIFRIHILGIVSGPTYEGIYVAGSVWLKTLTSLLAVLILTETTPVNRLFRGINSLGIPMIIVQIIEFTLRYFMVIHQEFVRIGIAQKSRGFEKGSHLLDLYTLKTIGTSVGHVFLRSLDRSERIYRAMVSRGYSQQQKSQEAFQPRPKDITAAFFMIAFTCFLVWLDKGGVKW